MKNWRIITVLLFLCLVLTGITACGGGKTEAASRQLFEVVRSDLVVSVSGSGNIDVSNEAKLAFGVGGRVDEIYVEEGDNVAAGGVLARLDTDALEVALTQTQVAVTQQEAAVTQAQVALKTAEYNLEKTRDLYTLSDIKIAQADVDEAERYLDEALRKLSNYDPGSPGEAFYQNVVIHAQSRLNAAKDKLDAMLSGTDPEEVVIEKLQVELAEQSLELAEQSLKLAEQSLRHAQKQLREATLTAPFRGMVADVNADEGDTVLATQTIIHLYDLSSLELGAEIDEIDIPSVKPGQRAIISLDALPDLHLEGTVSSIGLTPTFQAGLVLYDVTISFDVAADSEVKVGMSATVDIVIKERRNVLVVPNRAIDEDSSGNTIVKVMVQEQTKEKEELIEERTVITGISDGFDTEIISGLYKGETVVIKTRAKAQSSSSGGLFG